MPPSWSRRPRASCFAALASALLASSADARLLDARLLFVTRGSSVSESFDTIVGTDVPALTSSVLLGLLAQPGGASATLVESISSSSFASGTLAFASYGGRVFVREIRSPSNVVWEIDPETGAKLGPGFGVLGESGCVAALGDSFYFGTSRYDGISQSPSDGFLLAASATGLPYCATDAVDDRLYGWELVGPPPDRDLDLYRIDPASASRQRVGLFDLPPRTVPYVHFDRDAVYFSYFLDAAGSEAALWRWRYGAAQPTPIALPGPPAGGSDWALQDATEGVVALATFPSGQTLGSVLLLDDIAGDGVTFALPPLAGSGSLTIAVPEADGALVGIAVAASLVVAHVLRRR